MFPIQRSDELAYQILSDPHPHLPCQQNMISEDLILDYNYPFDYTSNSCPLLETNNHCHNSNVNNCSSSSSSSRKRKQKAAVAEKDDIRGGAENDEKLKKILHRDMEMSTLYSSLCSLLPVEYVKVCGEICIDVGGLQQKLSGVLNASRPNVLRVCME